jgi:two-component system sensor histidine kinase/response regulator
MPTSSLIARREFTAPGASRVVKILLVEDCKSDVYLFERMLENVSVNCFYDIQDVPRLVDAFYKIDREPFDLVMLDLNLLDIDGVASITALRAQAPNLPIIVYSGTDDARTKQKALMCGATHYLVKGKESGFGLKYTIERAVA